MKVNHEGERQKLDSLIEAVNAGIAAMPLVERVVARLLAHRFQQLLLSILDRLQTLEQRDKLREWGKDVERVPLEIE